VRNPDSEIPLDRSEAAIQIAYEFLLCVTELIATEEKIHIPPHLRRIKPFV
jgi:hypothetical protein